ncbi:phosphotransferase [Colwellia psychrerythraea]|uniref:Aminoglycoside phosphotransferase n=1 Tax=Colwellia psychrerythraea TaxID=28229 RepID=A0A099L727_COLPS|nr:phosphotransferase [Colwellia psychrerythraea]KGJ97683.1 aminoglycoside phosphotransferase [Colwellia psychrerythraea]
MLIPIDVINSLKSLPCFTEVRAISLLANGLSQTALKVTTATQVFFAKKLNEETASTEISCALLYAGLNIKDVSEQRIEQQLSPQVIYHDQHWLVTDFISGLTLTDTKLNNDRKISIALNMMAELHQFPLELAKYPIPLLIPTCSVKRLLTKPAPFLISHSCTLDKVTKSLSASINSLILDSTSSNVICHGDLNLTNILLDDGQRPWLIDFECAHVAPEEFDLAMFIAVNNIADQYITKIVAEYMSLVPGYRPNRNLLNYYILYSLYINGLWYFDNIDPLEPDNPMYALGIEQWSAFDIFTNEHAIAVPKLMSIINGGVDERR